LEVVVTFPAQIVSLPADGIIRNDIEVLLPNNGLVTTEPNPDDPDDAGTGAETHLGSLTINKRDAAGELILNDSAKFELWRCQEQEQDQDRKSTRLNSSHVSNSYAVFCQKKRT